MKTTSIKEELLKNGNIIFPNRGTSMLPLLREGRDVMIIHKKKKGKRFRKGDAVLFERANGDLVLHRISDVLRDGYLIIGDNCTEKEHVKEKNVLGIMTGVIRDGKKTIKVTDPLYRLYLLAWTSIFPIRKIYIKAGRRIDKMRKKY